MMGLRNSLAGTKIYLRLTFGLVLVLGFLLNAPFVDDAHAQAGQQPVAVLRVLNLVYDPIMESMGGKRLHEVFGWNDPAPMAEIYNDEIYERSHGFVDLQVIDTIVLDAYPPQWNGYVYTDENYTHRFRNGGWLNLLGLPEAQPNDWEPLGNAETRVQLAQSFKAAGRPLEKVQIGLSKIGNPTGDITVALRSSLTGADLRSKTIQPEEVQSRDPLSPTWVEKKLNDEYGRYYDTENGAAYMIVVKIPSADPNNYYQVSLRNPSSYADGQMYLTTSGTASPDGDMALKLMFSHGADYVKILDATPFTVQGVTKTIAEHVRDGRVDEVYLWGAPWFGYWESAMAGPGAFFINGGTYPEVASGRAFAVMGFNYERGVDCMLEDLAHRTEATMAYMYGGWQVDYLNHNWARFAANNQQSNGQAGCGTAHYPPNATHDYDYSNTREVSSYCDSFYNYPGFNMGQAQTVSNQTWRTAFPRYNRNGDSDEHWSYYAWWYDHFPRYNGVNSADSRLNNWWRYIFRPEFYKYGGTIHGTGNNPPTVSAGMDMTASLSAPVTLGGSVTDDGLPGSPAVLRMAWSKASGPGDVVFSNRFIAQPQTTFSKTGTYVLRLEADDGELATYEDVTIVVNDAPPANTPPTLPVLQGPPQRSVGLAVTVTALSTDPEGGKIRYTFDWGDGTSTTTGLLSSGAEGVSDHTYSATGNYTVKAKATDEAGLASAWSAPITLSVTESTVEVVTTTTATTRTYLGYSSSYAQQAQSFKAVGNRISRVTVALAKYGSPMGDITISIRASMSGSNLASATLSRQALTSTNYLSPTWVDVTFPGGVAVTPGSTYYLVLRASGNSSSAYYLVPLNSGNPYAYGSWYSGSSGAAQTSYDVLLKVAFGTAGNTSPDVPKGWAAYYTGKPNQPVNVSLNVTDPDGDRAALVMDWGDGTKSQSAWAASGTSISLSHTWPNEGTYLVRAQAVDEKGAASAWSAPVEVRIALASEETLVISDTSTSSVYLGYSYLRRRQSQSFKAIGSTIQKVSIPLAKMGLPYSSINVSIRASVSGSNLASGTIAPSQVVSTNPNSPAMVTLTFATPAQVTAGSTYFLVLEATSYNSSNCYRVGVNTANPYPYGMWYQDTTSNSGVDVACTVTFLK